MFHLLDTLREKPPVFDTVLHLGAGSDFEESLYNKLPAKKYILVEADPEVAERLRAQVPDSNFRIIECLLAGKESQQTFRRFSLSSLNGVFALGSLQALYPRAREVSALSLQARTLPDLLDSLHLDPAGKNALILDLPGLECDLLDSCGEMLAKQFDWIFVSGAGESHMDGAKPLSNTLKILQARHFMLLSHDTKSNPLTPLAILHRNTLALDNDNLMKELEVSMKNGAELEKKRAELAAQLEKLTAERSTLVTERDARTKERDQARAEKDNLTKECDALKKTASDRAARIAELEAQVAVQAERQKQIDEQMVRAEAQLEMLKNLVRPGLE